MSILRRSLFLTLGLLAISTPSLAAQQSRDTTPLAELVVTATRAAAPLRAVPASTTIIPGDELRARGITFVSDALREVPGMMLVQTGSYGAVMSLFLRGGESDYVKILLDGVTLNQPGGSFNLANLTTDDLDRIEIVRGPTSVLYGADAMSGVVQLFTRAGANRSHGTVAARGGSLGNRETQGQLAGGIGAFTLRAAGSSFRSDGLYDFNSNYRNSVGTMRLAVDGGTRGTAAVTLRYGDAVGHFPTDGNGIPLDQNQFTVERSTVLGLDLHRVVSRQLTASLQGSASRLHSDASNRPDSPSDTSGFGFESDRTGITWRKGLDARADWRARHAMVLSLGAGIEDESEVQSSRTVSNFGTGVFASEDAFRADRHTRNVYAQLLTEPLAALSLQLGARLDDNSAFGSFATWKIGAGWQWSAETRLYLAAGTAFKAPTFSELFARSAYEVGNRALHPERSTSREAGLEQRLLQHRVVVTASAFWQEFRDLIQYVGSGPGAPTYLNLGAAKSAGVEVALALRPAGSMALRAHWTWLRTEVSDSGAASSVVFQQGERLLRRPASSGGMSATLRLAGATVGAGVTHIGPRDDADFRDFPATRTTLPSYTLVDLSVDAPIRPPRGSTPGLDLTLRAENLLDAEWSQAVGFPGRGRILFGGARLHF